jgi:hypothetical protein
MQLLQESPVNDSKVLFGLEKRIDKVVAIHNFNCAYALKLFPDLMEPIDFVYANR